MIPGGFATKAILGLFAVATQHAAATNDMLIGVIESTVQVAFIVGALGTGIAIPGLLLRIHRPAM